MAAAKVAFYEKGLQPAVDDAISQNRPAHVVDVASLVHLHAGDGGVDPHFWQDPVLLAGVAGGFTAGDGARRSRARRRTTARNLAALDADLRELDGELRAGLAHCRTRSVVVSHDAFEYLGRRYDLHVHAIAGLSPDAEPSAKKLSDLADLARRTGSARSSARPSPAPGWPRRWPTTPGCAPRCSTRSRG